MIRSWRQHPKRSPTGSSSSTNGALPILNRCRTTQGRSRSRGKRSAETIHALVAPARNTRSAAASIDYNCGPRRTLTVNPTLAHSFIGQPVNLLEQQQPDYEAGLDPRPAVLAVERRDLAVDPVPINLAGQQNQLVLHVDDLVQPRPEQIVRSRRLVLLRPHRPLRCNTESRPSIRGNLENEIARFRGL